MAFLGVPWLLRRRDGGSDIAAIYAPAKAFPHALWRCVAGMFLFGSSFCSRISRFAARLGLERIARLPMHLRFFPYSTWLGIAALLGIAASTFYVRVCNTRFQLSRRFFY